MSNSSSCQRDGRATPPLGSHKVQGVRAAIEARGARQLHLPPDSPDLNPIGQLFDRENHSAAVHAIAAPDAFQNNAEPVTILTRRS